MLPVESGFRFCVFRGPARRTEPRGCVLIAPPFAEELNKSRRMLALAAERIAAAGFAVLHVDCFGCGDSSGDFADATWDEWIADLQRGYDWLASRYDRPFWILGVRAGALLAVETLPHLERSPNLVFWQPVVSGGQYLMQFLRLKFASEFIGDGSKQSSTRALVEQLAAGELLEIAGYSVTQKLATALGKSELRLPHGFNGNIACFEIVTSVRNELRPALRTCVELWRGSGLNVVTKNLTGVQFWQTQQITEAPEVIDATCSHLLDALR